MVSAMTQISITLNGHIKAINNKCSIQNIIEQEGYGGMMIAIARNGEFVPRDHYDQTLINDGDDIEIVAPMQGG
jgi:sulfur carrier protein